MTAAEPTTEEIWVALPAVHANALLHRMETQDEADEALGALLSDPCNETLDWWLDAEHEARQYANKFELWCRSQ